MEMEAVRAAVEQACLDFKDPTRQPQAEQVLLQFRRSTNPIQACQHILEHSPSYEARFHAVLTLREAVVREWACLAPQTAQSLRSYLLQYAVKLSGDPAATLVSAQLVAVLALMLKRGWLQEGQEEHARFFQELLATVAGTAAAERVGVSLLEAVVSEFALSSASPLGLPWDYHDKAAKDVEAHFLQSFFLHAANLARQCTASGAAVSGGDSGLCLACMSLLVAILGWDFRRANTPAHVHAMVIRRGGGLDGGLQVTPGTSWAGLLLGPEATAWLGELLGQLAGAARQASPAAQALSAKARQLLVALCSLSGDVFPKPSEDPQGLRLAHLTRLLGALLPWLWPAEAALRAAVAPGSDEAQLVDACKAVAALASTHKVGTLEQAGRAVLTGVPGAPSASPLGFVAVLEQATLGLLAVGRGAGARDEHPWLQDCTDVLLEAWSHLVQPEYTSPGPGLPPACQPAPQPVADASAAVFQAVVEAALAQAAAGAYEDADDDEEAGAAASTEDSLVRLAGLARVSPARSMAGLAAMVWERQQGLASPALWQGGSAAELLEQLCWLLRMAAHALADSGAGETPLVPLALTAALEAGGADAGAVEALSRGVLEVAALVLREGATAFMSPRLMETCVWCLARWADTYLLPEQELPGQALQQAYGAPGPASSSVLDMVVRVASACLSGYPGEAELHKQVCCVLLPVLVRRKPLAAALAPLPSWQALAQAFATRQPGMAQQLGQKMHRALAQSLCLAASGLPTRAAQQSYASQLMQRVTADVVGLAGRQDLAALAQRADVATELCCLLEALRGAARGVLSKTQAALWALCSQVLSPLLRLQHAFSGHSLVVALSLKLAGDMVESHVSYLGGGDVEVLLRWVLQLLQQYTALGRWAGVALGPGAGSSSAGGRALLAEEERAEQARDLRALLRLLQHVTQRDLVDFSEDAQVDVAQVVLLGLDTIMPLMSQDMLKFPKLCTLYFSLLAYVLEVYPEQVSQLQGTRFAQLMAALEYGLMATDGTVVQSAIEGLAGLAKFQFQSQTKGLPGFAAHSANGKSVTTHFLEVMFKKLLLEDTASELVELSADALLPLILCDLSAYQQLGSQLLQSQGDPAASNKMSAALEALLNSNGVQPNLTGPSKRKFRQNLCQMVSELRGLMRVR